MKRMACWILGAFMLAGSATSTAGQGVAIIPQMGTYMPASDFYELRDQANDIRLEKKGTLGLGLAVELGWLRGSIAYASGARLTEHGVSGGQDIGDGSVLAAAADLVIRPLPRFVIQPYLLGGVGLKDASYDANSGFDGVFPKDETRLAAHIGAGADLMLGPIGVLAEITDFISRNPENSWKVHDAFAMVGLKFRL